MRRVSVRALPFLAVAMLTACHSIDGPVLQTGPRNAITLEEPYRLGDGTTLPVGTVLSDAEDVTGRPFIHFTLPQGYSLVSVARGAPDAEIQSVPDAEVVDQGSITCTCTTGSGCSPFKASGLGGTVVGCANTGSCGQCVQVVNAISPTAAGIVILGDRDTELLHLDAGISFVTSREEMDSLSCPRGAALRWSGFTRPVGEYMAGFQLQDRPGVLRATRREELPDGYTMLFLNAYGKLLRVPVQRGLTISEQVSLASFPLARHSETAASEPDLASTTCRCLSGSTGCKYEKKSVPLVGYAEWCEAGACQSCQMSF